ncbi:MAG: acetylornithine/succinylornithine family transaminase [Christensenellaceae bacterium]|jgi:acetylornithine/N-succinyldiaminopimelate aminotransferase|nr:acetylornithine/succinylornithine family transaminase [Christensenellaceae bacterium]
MQFDSIKARDDAAIMHTYARFPVALERGQNATCWDADGKEYIDLTAGIGVNALGFSDEGWQKAIAAQLGKLQHISNLYYTLPCIQAAEKLKELSGMEKVFFSNSGAESNEGAIKAARKYSLLKYGEGRSTIVSLENSFHGRTVTTLAATGQMVFHKDFFPFTEGFVFAKANDWSDTLEKLGQQGVCAILMELVQGEGGVLPLDQAYVSAVVDYCHKNDILVIIDEVQTGMARTGSFLAYQQFGFLPDLCTMAKGIGGGLPLGAVLFGEKTKEALVPGDHASTYGGNPIACAGAVEVLSRVSSEFLAEVAKKGEYITKKLLSFPHVAGVSGLGLMLGASLEGVTSRDVVVKGNELGVLTLTAKEKLRLLPPLTISYEEIDKGLARLEETLKAL